MDSKAAESLDKYIIGDYASSFEVCAGDCSDCPTVCCDSNADYERACPTTSEDM